MRIARVLVGLLALTPLLLLSVPVSADPETPIGDLPLCGDEGDQNGQPYGSIEFSCADFDELMTDVQVFQVPEGVTSITIDWIFNHGVGLDQEIQPFLRREVAIFSVDDAQGRINGVEPGTRGYDLFSRRQVIYRPVGSPSETPASPDVTLPVVPGDLLAFALFEEVIDLGSDISSSIDPLNLDFFDRSELDDRFVAFRSSSQTEIAFESVHGDGDYDDFVFTISPALDSAESAGPNDPLDLGVSAAETPDVITLADTPSPTRSHCVARFFDGTVGSPPTACFSTGALRDSYLEAAGLFDFPDSAPFLLGTHYDLPRPSDTGWSEHVGPSLAILGDACLLDINLNGTFWDDRISATRNGCAAIGHFETFAGGTPPVGPTGRSIYSTGDGILSLGALANESSALRYLPVAPPPPTPDLEAITVLLLGDSYAAGNGARNPAGDPVYVDPPGCFRSSANWASQYVRFLRDSGLSVKYRNRACSGATTENLFGPDLTSDNEELDPQLDHVNSSIDLVLLSLGGNDLRFSDIATACLVEFRNDQILGQLVSDDRDIDECNRLLDEARDAVADRGPESPFSQIVEVLTEIHTRSDGNARVVYVDYPHLIRNRPGLTDDPYVFEGADIGRQLEELQQAGQALQQAAVDEANATVGTSFVTYVDGNKPEFANHELEAPFPQDAEEEWLVDVRLRTAIVNGQEELVHPNADGHAAYTRVVAGGGDYGAADDPDVAIDVVFVVNATAKEASVADDLASYAPIIFDTVTATTNMARFAVVSYRDFPEVTGISSDYPSRIETGFTTDRASFVAASTISSSGGALGPDSVLSGIDESLGLSWRDGVTKHIVLIGDSSHYDVEPNGLTVAEVGLGAYFLDPAEIHLVDDEAPAPAIADLIAESGGVALTSPASGIGESVAGLVGSILNKPVADAGGPYLTSVGDPIVLDARGSHDTQTSIVEYRWDLDGDRIHETTTPEPTVVHPADREYDGLIGLEVVDDEGWTHTATAPLTVSLDGDDVPQDLDNCPTQPNHTQADADGDGLGDACDPNPIVPLGGSACDDLSPTILGSDASETIDGTRGDDIIVALGGDDIIDGRGGNDVICAGSGADIIVTGTGDDIVDTGSGNDSVDTGRGDDLVHATVGDHLIVTGRGDDVVFAGPGDDVIRTEQGDDIISSGGGDDDIDPGDGNNDVF